MKQFVLPSIKSVFGKKGENYFREFWAVNNINLTVKRGETIGIIGRNGSGKSTLLQMICGTLNPTLGSISITGRVAALLELGSGFNPEFTGRENVYLNGAILGLTRQEIDARFDEIVNFADIGDFIDQPVKTYSSGMYVRLAFAVIAHVDADILIIDEALAVGDAFFTQKCMRFLRSFMETGTILFVSHDTGAIKNLCDRVLWLDKGVAIREGNPKEVCDSYLEAYYSSTQQNAISVKDKNNTKHQSLPINYKDQRADIINHSNLRNDLRVFEFKPEQNSFGKGDAQIVSVELLDEAENTLCWVVGGEYVSVRIKAIAHEKIEAPIVGFLLKDRLGQYLFGDNTFLSHGNSFRTCPEGRWLITTFKFLMPILPIGEYFIDAAIASGTQESHIQHHWIYDALVIKSESSSVVTGLIGVPMLAIDLDVIEQ